MTLTNDAKFEEKMTLGSKNDMRNLINFNASSSSSLKIWCATFVECILYLTPKGTEELCVITLQNDTKFEEELTYALKNDMGNLANFDTTFESLKNRSLMGSFWPNYIMKKLQLCVMKLMGNATFKEILTGGLKMS